MKTFEKRLQRLEEISDSIRKGELALEESIHLFEEGMELARQLESELHSVEGRIEKLIKEPGQNGEPPEFEIFPETQEP